MLSRLCLVTTIRDLAPNTQVDFVEAVFSCGPYGTKGLGEVHLMASYTDVSRAIARVFSA